MKRIAITTMTALAFFASAIAQAPTGRIPAKGFAMFSAEDTFHPYEFTRHAIGDNDIYPDEVEIIKANASEIDKAWRNVADGKVKFRYVIDLSTIK